MKISIRALFALIIIGSGLFLWSSHYFSFIKKETSIYCDPPNYEECTNLITENVISEFYKRYPITIHGFGGSAMDVVRELFLAFLTLKPFTLEEARELVINCTEIYLCNINSNQGLRPYLIEYPFPSSGIQLDFYSYPANPQTDAILAGVGINQDQITYWTRDPATGFPRNMHKETYEEARAIVEKAGKLIACNQLDNHNLTITKETMKSLKERRAEIKAKSALYHKTKYTSGPEPCKKMYWILDDYGEQVAEKEDLLFHRTGVFLEHGSPNVGDVWYGLMFQSDRKLTLDEGQLYAATLVADFLKMLQTDPRILEYHTWDNSGYKNCKCPPFLTPAPDIRQVCWKLAFWDENVNRPQAPYLAEIRFEHSEFLYFVADPHTQALQLVKKESYQDALSR